MTTTAGALLLNAIQPLIWSAIARGAVKFTGAEDVAEVQQDVLVMAAKILDSVERAGKTVTPGNVAFYAIQAAKSGRRSNSASRVDVLAPSTLLDKKVSLTSVDAPLDFNIDDDGEATLHDILGSTCEAPDCCAARQLDWDMVEPVLDTRQRQILQDSANELPVKLQAEMHDVSPARIVQLKHSIGERIAEVWGGNPSVDAGREPAWCRYVQTYAARRACRYQRRMA